MTLEQAEAATRYALERHYSVAVGVRCQPRMAPPVSVTVELASNADHPGLALDLEQVVADFAGSDWRPVLRSDRRVSLAVREEWPGDAQAV